MSNKEQISKIPAIVDIEEIHPTVGMEKVLGKQKYDTALKMSHKIFVYKFIYKSNGHKVVGYLVEPRKGKNLPCIIWNRGGSREFGSIKPSYLFVNSIASLAHAGYIVIASQYSGNGGSEGKDEHGGSDIEDVINFYKILKKYKRADTKRIGMCGSSRGGMVSFRVLEKVKWLKALVVRAPVTNLFHQVKNRPELKELYKSMFGSSKEEMEKRSAIFWVKKLYKKAPILMMHGTADWRVNVADTLDMAKKLYQEHIPYRMLIYEGDDHTLIKNNANAVENTIEWFNRFVKNEEQLPNLKLHGD